MSEEGGLFPFCGAAEQPVKNEKKALETVRQIEKKLKTSIVSIKVKCTHTAYGQTNTWQGTGFVCDLRQKIIVTNHHVIGRGAVASYEVVFSNGKKLEARLLYVDPWHDFGFLKITDNMSMPEGTGCLDTFVPARVQQNVWMMGTNQGHAFSVQNGHVTNIYQDVGFLPEPSFSIALNSAGGSSGSPIVTSEGHVMGLNYAGGGRLAYALHGEVIQKALKSLLRGKMPRRFHTGAIVKLIPSSKAMQYSGLPSHKAAYLMKMFPEAEGRLLMVVGCLRGSPAQKILKKGDVIWSVGNTLIGPCLKTFEAAMNATQGRSAMIAVYRKGHLLTFSLPTYNLHNFVINRLVLFGGATFFEADDQMRWQFGVLPKQLIVNHIQPATCFSRGLVPSASMGQDTEFQHRDRMCSVKGLSLDRLIKKIPSYIQKKDFILFVRWLHAVPSFMGNMAYEKPDWDWCGVSYTDGGLLPQRLDFNHHKGCWDLFLINQEK